MQEGADELFQAMELEMEARAPSNAAFLAAQQPRGRAAAAVAWALSFAIPGMGMFTEAYFVFSVRLPGIPAAA